MEIPIHPNVLPAEDLPGALGAVNRDEFAHLSRAPPRAATAAVRGWSSMPELALGQQPSSVFRFVREAYERHIPVALRPDNVWLDVLTALSDFVGKHPEAARKHFVEHQGKRQLSVVSGAVPRTAADWHTNMFEQFETEIAANTRGVAELLRPEFSTTTETDRACARIALMAVCKDFFEFVGMCLCGLPRIRVDGTAADWAKLREHVHGVAQLLCAIAADSPPEDHEQFAKAAARAGASDLTTLDGFWAGWGRNMDLVLEHFGNVVAGAPPDAAFWSKIIQLNECGSGHHTYRGWAPVFDPIDNNRLRVAVALPFDDLVDTEISSYGVGTRVSVPMRLVLGSGSVGITLAAGAAGAEVDGDYVTLAPGWVAHSLEDTESTLLRFFFVDDGLTDFRVYAPDATLESLEILDQDHVAWSPDMDKWVPPTVTMESLGIGDGSVLHVHRRMRSVWIVRGPGTVRATLTEVNFFVPAGEIGDFRQVDPSRSLHAQGYVKGRTLVTGDPVGVIFDVVDAVLTIKPGLLEVERDGQVVSSLSVGTERDTWIISHGGEHMIRFTAGTRCAQVKVQNVGTAEALSALYKAM